MPTLQQSFVVTALVFCRLFLAAVAKNGTANFYTPPYVPSACYGYKDEGTMIAAASDETWDSGNACGQNYTARCVGATNKGVAHPCRGSREAVATIVDYCPHCRGTIDLSQETFKTIADQKAGKIKVFLYKC